MSSLTAASAEARRWLFSDALPFWSLNGVDRTAGGFHDLLDMQSGRVTTPMKRTFVQGRQVYVFAEAGRLGWEGPWRQAVETGLQTLETACRHADWGYVNTLGEGNVHAETRRDLYDQAFSAFACAHAAQQVGSPALLTRAREILTQIEANWSRPPGGFFEGELVTPLPRRQNPHMHLLEASVALATTTGAQEDINRANAMARFAADMLIAGRGYLCEYFDENWTPVPRDGHIVVEPGHHFEWAWIFCGLARAGGDDHTDLAAELWRFGLRHGIDAKRGVAINEIGHDGAIISAQARLWPQTERLKAALAMVERGEAGAEAEAVAAFNGLQLYLRAPIAGTFFDKYGADGKLVSEPARASSLYHITCAFAELIRVAG